MCMMRDTVYGRPTLAIRQIGILRMVVGRPKQIFIVVIAPSHPSTTHIPPHREIGRVDLHDDLRQHVALLPDKRVGDPIQRRTPGPCRRTSARQVPACRGRGAILVRRSRCRARRCRLAASPPIGRVGIVVGGSSPGANRVGTPGPSRCRPPAHRRPCRRSPARRR